VLLGDIVSDIRLKVSLVSPEGQTFSIEVLPSADNGYQLILRGFDLHILIAVRLALLRRLEVCSQTHYLFHIVIAADVCSKVFFVI